MKLLFFGDLSPTGFGTVTMDAGVQLLDLGVDVRFVSQNDLGELPPVFAARTLDVATFAHEEANGSDVHGGVSGVRSFIPDVLSGNAGTMKLANGEPWGDWKPDATILLGDFYGMRLMTGPYLDAFKELPSFHYVPVEGHGLPPLWNELWSVIKPIAMTDFGQAEIAKVTGYLPPRVYHGVDADVFRPVSVDNPLVIEQGMTRTVLTSKERCKAFFGINPEATIILRTDRNMPRKGYPAMLRALSPVLRGRPRTGLVLHCRAWDQGGYLHDSISKLPDDVQRKVMVPDLWRSIGFVPRPVLVALYNAADLYVSTSAEGFGLTIAEALACGVPVVGLDYSAVPEVIGPAGVCVPVGQVHDNEYAHHWALPDEEKFGAAVAYLLDHPAKRRELGRLGPKHVRESFRWDVAARQFMDICTDALPSSVTLSEPRSAVVTAERELVAA